MFESPVMDKLRHIEHIFARLLWKTQRWGVGNPFTRANSPPYIEALIFTTFTLTLMTQLPILQSKYMCRMWRRACRAGKLIKI